MKWFGFFVKVQRPLAVPSRQCLSAWARRLSGWRHAAAAVGGGVSLFCCSGEIWHGDERERAREWDSLLGINVSSEVWTEHLTMGSNDWKHNGKKQTCFLLICFHIHSYRPIHGLFHSEHNRLPLQTGAPAFMRVRASMHSTSVSVRIASYFKRKKKCIETTHLIDGLWWDRSRSSML